MQDAGHLHRRLRRRRLRRRAYIRSVHLLPSLATLGNAVCGFAAMYVSMLPFDQDVGSDPWTLFFARHGFFAASYLILAAAVFDALDGRLARFARHTTDFGGQLDSLADMISFGAAPAMLALQVFKHDGPNTIIAVSRLIWAIGGLSMCCAAIRLARFNVSNEHGEQAHMSFLGLPSPGAAGAIVGLVLMQQDLRVLAAESQSRILEVLAQATVWMIPPVVLCVGLLMVSKVRYPHVVNRYLRGRRSVGRLVALIATLLLLVVAHRYVLGVALLGYALLSPIAHLIGRRRTVAAKAATAHAAVRERPPHPS